MKLTTISLLFALCATIPAVRAEEKLVPLKLELPSPLFVGTPVPIKLPNLEPARQGERPEFLVPEGTVNLALHKKVTASDNEPIIGELEQVTDGDKDGGDGHFVEFAPGRQYVQIDLEKPSHIYAIVIWHYHQQARAYHDVVVQTADDADFITGVKTIYNNDHDNSSGLGIGKDPAYIDTAEGRLIDAKGVTARFVRCYSKGNTSNEMNHYIEVEVWGKPAQ